MPPINITILVDVIGALSDKTLLNQNLCMMDDGPSQSLHQGTANLCTRCHPGQLVQWTIYAIDLQTPVAIKNIVFGDANGKFPENPKSHGDDNPDANVWSGIVPADMTPGTAYRYRLQLQMHQYPNSVMHIDTPSLMRV